MNKEDLIELREIFRARMDDEDFCIGQEKVEKIFRELLGEPKPVEEAFTGKPDPMLREIFKMEIEKMAKNLPDLFERDDTFYRRMKR